MRFVLIILILVAGVAGQSASFSPIAVIPQPAKVTAGRGEFFLTPSTVIVMDSALKAQGRQLADMLGRATGFDLEVRSGSSPGSGFIALRLDKGLEKSLGGYALSKGKTVLVAEAGRSGLTLTGDVDALVNGCLNVLGSLKMIARTVTPVPKPVWVTGGTRIAADKPGMFFATAARDTIVHEGDSIGYTTDYVGRPTGNVRSPVTGLITFIRGVPSMWSGATLANVSPVLIAVPPYKKP